LKKFVGAEALAPNITCRLDLRACRSGWRCKDPGVHRCDPWEGVGKSSIALVRKNETKVAIFSSTKCGGDIGSIGLDFVGEEPNRFVDGLAVNLGQHRVLKVDVFDVGNVARQHGWRYEYH
jgi:hypothetical protein